MWTKLRVLLVTSALVGRIAAAGEPQKDLELSLLPGESRVISHSHSASRDTALLAYSVLPWVVLTTGGDFAVLGFKFHGMDLRAGMFGMIEVQTVEPEPLNFLSVPGGPYLWRGLLGYSLALSFDDCARRWLGHRGGLEAAASFRHESEHFTGSGENLTEQYEDVPNIGDFILLDLAARKALGPVDMEIRAQNKFFLPTSKGYTFGPGGDLIFIYRVTEWVHPFVSLFGEYLFGGEINRDDREQKVADNFLVRGLIGALFPGDTADLQIVFVMDVGHGKGLLAYNEDWRFGWAIRIGFFKLSPLSLQRPHPKLRRTGP